MRKIARSIRAIWATIIFLFILPTFSNLETPTNINVTCSENVCTSSGCYENFRDSKTNKWIVLTSWSKLTNAIAKLVYLQNWKIVVVKEGERPQQEVFTSENIHHVNASSVAELDLSSVFGLILDNESIRRNIGYLYAIKNGAKYIYEGDENFELYGQISAAFDFEKHVSGLWYYGSELPLPRQRIFHPTEFFALRTEKPKTEMRKKFTRPEGRLCLCRNRPAPAVQHAVVQAEQSTLWKDHAEINKFAPPITIGAGTYSIWQADHTLFHYKAFFVLVRPLSPKLRIRTIFSLYAQKLLNLVGLNHGFYPVDVIPGTAGYDSFDGKEGGLTWQEISAIVSLFESWKCSHYHIQKCMIDLAKMLKNDRYLELEHIVLVHSWIQDLKAVGYKFPRMVYASRRLSNPCETRGNGKCRRANLELMYSVSARYRSPQIEQESTLTRARAKISACRALQRWCACSDRQFNCDAASATRLMEMHRKQPALEAILDTVLVVFHNHPRLKGMGLLQQLYQPYFGITIFCGTWYPQIYDDNGQFPHMIRPFNFIHMSEDEIHKGVFMYNCISTVKDLRLRNVKGYFMTADDTIFHFWQKLQLDEILYPRWVIFPRKPSAWWGTEFGESSALRARQLFTQKYKNDYKVQKTWACYKEGLRANGYTDDPALHVETDNGWTLSDFFFVPQKRLEYLADVADVFYEARLFLELAMNKILYTVPFRKLHWNNFTYIPPFERHRWLEYYRPDQVMIHPIKISAFADRNKRNLFFVPQKRLEYLADVADVFYEARLFLELAMNKILYTVPFRKLHWNNFTYIPPFERHRWLEYYRPDQVMIHPIKISAFADRNKRNLFCKSVVHTFMKALMKCE
ncbi:hypothetical protein Q1695_013010 [Nippostrongylus brasiliensis]|nr:hypothetical protein Q1695_013010 [Nippostrongylus brasiliensis]